MAKRWQKEDLEYLKRHAAAKSLPELAKHLRLDAASVGAKLGELGQRAVAGVPLEEGDLDVVPAPPRRSRAHGVPFWTLSTAS